MAGGSCRVAAWEPHHRKTSEPFVVAVERFALLFSCWQWIWTGRCGAREAVSVSDRGGGSMGRAFRTCRWSHPVRVRIPSFRTTAGARGGIRLSVRRSRDVDQRRQVGGHGKQPEKAWKVQYPAMRAGLSREARFSIYRASHKVLRFGPWPKQPGSVYKRPRWSFSGRWPGWRSSTDAAFGRSFRSN